MKDVISMAMFLWKRLEIISQIDFPGREPGITCWEEKRKLFKKNENITKTVMEEYSKEKFNSSLPVLMVASEFLIDSPGFFGKREESEKIIKFLLTKYKDCGASWTATGRGCCASARAEAMINSKGEIFAYKLSWSPATGRGDFKVFQASDINSVTDALDDFNHFKNEKSQPATNYTIFPSEDWENVVKRFQSSQYQHKVRVDQEARDSWKDGKEFIFGITTYCGWYKPSISLGLGKMDTGSGRKNYETDEYKMKIASNLPAGEYRLYIDIYPVVLTVDKGRLNLRLCASSHWCNSQSWRLDHHSMTNIKTGWIFVNGKDVYENTMNRIQEMRQEIIASRSNKFQEAKTKALEAGVTQAQISQIIKASKKGKVIASLCLSSKIFKIMGKKEFMKIFTQEALELEIIKCPSK